MYGSLTAFYAALWKGKWVGKVLDRLPRLSAARARLCEKPITATEIWEMINDCTSRRSFGSDGLPNGFDGFMSDLFGEFLSGFYC